MDNSRLVGTFSTVALEVIDAGIVDAEAGKGAKDVEMITGKRRRGRPPRIQGKNPQLQQSHRRRKNEEDVCFICFDGGSLFLCDRRGCPKAYHAACIKRDESFFRSKAKWNCGWHICSSCQKDSHYLCYMCTYSLCKGCTKGADYYCVRGNRGFCGTCMKIIKLIENVSLGTNEMVQVNFDDETSWEYLFKVYWICLKEKLSLTSFDLTRAKNPWKEDQLPKARKFWNAASSIIPHYVSSAEVCIRPKKGSFLPPSADVPKRQRRKHELGPLNERCPGLVRSNMNEGTFSKELCEFVAYMQNIDIPILSKDVALDLVMEYVEKNYLFDLDKESQIVCDSRLKNLLGKALVDRAELPALLDLHFVLKSKTPVDENELATTGNGGRRRGKKMEERDVEAEHPPDKLAAIDVHNISLLYLKRSLMENLLDDAESFHDKVVGSFVRLKISGANQKQETHKLVRVVGVTLVEESYYVGKRLTNVKLEVMDSDYKDVVSIDALSNQDFSEEECRCLLDSVTHGHTMRLTVGEVQEKAMVLQSVKDSNRLEAEIERLHQHGDAIANQKKHTRELRDCLEKLEFLESPMGRLCGLLETPVVHVQQPEPEAEANSSSPQDLGCVENGGQSSATASNQEAEALSGPANNGGLVMVGERELSAADMEKENLWHYQDPTGKIQGPFSMMLLRKWSENHLFPLDVRVWMTDQKQDQSVLLTEALAGRSQIKHDVPSPAAMAASDNTGNKSEFGTVTGSEEESVDGKTLPSSSSSPKQSETPLTSVMGSHGEEQTCKNERESCSTQSSGQNWQPPIGSGEIDFFNLPTPTPKPCQEENQNSDADQADPSSLMIGKSAIIEVAAGEWSGGFSSASVRPSVKEWDINFEPDFTLKLIEGGNHDSVASPMATEPAEFCSLVDESVSDLLAEVEAMESLCNLPSPTSKMTNRGAEATPSANPDYFDLGRGDASSSTGDGQFQAQLPIDDEPLRLSLMPSHRDIIAPHSSFSGHSSVTTEAEQWDVASLDRTTMNHHMEASSTSHPPPLPPMMTHWEVGPELHCIAPAFLDSLWESHLRGRESSFCRDRSSVSREMDAIFGTGIGAFFRPPPKAP